ncbi:hypothetical protein F8388_000451 [Cannabis sativa]|nr:hypothetical protein F8388_000451 [Cannabis sativa]
MSMMERNNVEEDESFFYAVELRSSVVLPMSLFATIELGVFEILAKAGDGAKLSSSDIASHLPTENPDAPMMLDRILTLLASHSVLDCVVVGESSSMRKLYSLSPVSKHFLLEAHGASSHAIMKLGLDKFWKEGVEHVAGDMFEKIPNGDAIFMKWILHDWNDEDCVKILKKCYEATPSNGKVINVDMVIPIMAETTHEAKSIFQSDLVMLSQIPGGKERNQHEFQAIAYAAGFKTINFACPIGNVRVMEFIK